MVHTTRPIDDRTRQKVVEKKEAGLSNGVIAEHLGISISSVKRFLKAAKTGDISPKKVDRSGCNNPNAKITPEYEQVVLNLLENQNDLFDAETAAAAADQTGIILEEKAVGRIRKRFRITIKKKSTLYESRLDPSHQAQNETWLREHHPNTGTVPLQYCMSSDEAGFKNTITRTNAKSRIMNRRNRYRGRVPLRRIAGSSYKANRFRAYSFAPKHATAKFNLILTLSLDPGHSVVHYEIHDRYINREIYANYILNRQDIEGYDYDIIDRASFHRLVNALGDAPCSVSEAYNVYSEVTRDYVPTGWPQYNPVEQAFGWIKQKLKEYAPCYNMGRGWDKEQMKRCVRRAIALITHKMVKAWYLNSFKHTYPNLRVPMYLKRADMI